MDLDIIAPIDWANSDDIIKVLGVGGGGCNAVNYMFHQNIQGCSFLACNTDSQALNDCDVPVKIQLGKGLGAGTDPSIGRNAALESQNMILEKIKANNTKMIFITAGMGGGTGTGATPVIAKLAKDAGILTVGVVTLPFLFEGPEKLSKAIDGIHELTKNVDSLIIIKNENLYAFYGDKLIHEAFPKVDEVLATAVKGIVEIIKKKGYINIDFMDIQNMMRGSGMALMGCGEGQGKNRLEDAVKSTFESPLLNDFDLTTAKNLLLNISVGKNDQGLTMNQQNELNKKISAYTGNANNFKYGLILEDDPNFGDKIKITAIATGFKFNTVLGAELKKTNIIVIDKNFTYDKKGKNRLSVDSSMENFGFGAERIGYNSADSKLKLPYDINETPSMLSEDNEVLRSLENTPAIRRIQQ